jgi:hypothetical protein
VKFSHEAIDAGSTEDLRVDLYRGDEHEDSLEEGEVIKFAISNYLEEVLKSIFFLNGTCKTG